jgi:outer membrane protein assembly factor BamB
MYGHDVKHTFRSNLVGPADGSFLDPTPVNNEVRTEPVVSSDGLFFIGGAWLDPTHVSARGGNSLRGAELAVRADGYLLWETLEGGSVLTASGAVDTDGFLYYGGRDNILWKQDAETGAAICKKYIQSDGDIQGSPTISVKFPNRVYFTDTRGAVLFALDVSTSGNCTLVWNVVMGRGTDASISLADTVPGNGDSLGYLITNNTNTVFQIRDDGDSATIVAQRQIGTIVTAIYGPTPLVHPDTGNIYIGSLDHHLYALRPDLTDLFPAVDLGAKIQGPAALSPDGMTIYVVTMNGELHALDALTGTERTGFPFVAAKNLDRQNTYAPVVDGEGTIYYGGTDTFLRAINPDGSVKWATQLPGVPGTAAIVNGGLIVPEIAATGLNPFATSLYRFCPPPTGPPTAENVCGFTVDTTFTPFPVPTPTPTASPSPTPAGTPSPGGSPTPTSSASQTPGATPSPNPNPTPTPSPAPTPTPTSSPAHTPTPSPARTPISTPPPTPTPTHGAATPTPTATANVFNNASLFAAQQFMDFFGRAGGPAGISFWANQINSGSLTRAQVTAAFYSAPEFQGEFPPIARLYFAYFKRIPNFDGIEYWIKQLQGGTSLASISESFAASSEFQNIYGRVDDAGFIDIVYLNTLGRMPTEAEVTNALGQLAAGTSRGALMVTFSQSSQFVTSSANEVFVTAIYVSMLRRSPTQAELTAAVTALSTGSTQVDLINGVLNSTEYHDRF